jgi:hypothetical protein
MLTTDVGPVERDDEVRLPVRFVDDQVATDTRGYRTARRCR